MPEDGFRFKTMCYAIGLQGVEVKNSIPIFIFQRFQSSITDDALDEVVQIISLSLRRAAEVVAEVKAFALTR